MSFGIPRHIPRTAQNVPDWDNYAKLGPLQSQRATHWRYIHNHTDIHTDTLFQVSQWLEDNYHIPFVLSLLYVIAVFGIKAIMTNKKPFGLKLPLALWNLGLARMKIPLLNHPDPSSLQFHRGNHCWPSNFI